MDKTDLAETLLGMLAEYGADTLEIVPEDNEGNELGVILVLSPEAAPDFRALVRRREARGDFVK